MDGAEYWTVYPRPGTIEAKALVGLPGVPTRLTAAASSRTIRWSRIRHRLR